MEQDAASIDLIAGAYTEELNTKDVAVWIDPIDGSQAFVDGDLEEVTNLIGITHKSRPIVGIIHKCFTHQRRNSSRTYVGSTESGLFYFDHSKVDKTTSSPTYVAPFDGGRFAPQMCFGANAKQQNIMQNVF